MSTQVDCLPTHVDAHPGNGTFRLSRISWQLAPAPIPGSGRRRIRANRTGRRTCPRTEWRQECPRVVGGSQARAEAHRAPDQQLTPSTYVKLADVDGGCAMALRTLAATTHRPASVESYHRRPGHRRRAPSPAPKVGPLSPSDHLQATLSIESSRRGEAFGRINSTVRSSTWPLRTSTNSEPMPSRLSTFPLLSLGLGHLCSRLRRQVPRRRLKNRPLEPGDESWISS